jgi:hypothetical protein
VFVRASNSTHSFTFPRSLPARLNLAAVLTAVDARVSICVFNRHLSRQSRRGGLLYHGAGPGVTRCDVAEVSSLVDDLRLADARLVFCGRNLAVRSRVQQPQCPL